MIGRFALLLAVCVAAAGQSPDTEFARGMAFAREGKLDDAAVVFEAGRRSWPRDKRFPTELAGIAWRKQQNGRAKDFLRRALELDPTDSYANVFLGTLYLQDNNLRAALKYWNRVQRPLLQTFRTVPPLRLNPLLEQRALYLSGGQVLTLDRLEGAEASLRRLGILASWRFDLSPRQDDRYDLVFRPVPVASPVSGWLGRILPFVRGLPFQAVNVDRWNIAGRAVNLTSLWRWDPDKRRIAVELDTPVRLNPRLKASALLDLRDERWSLGSGLDNLVLRRYEAGGSFTFGLRGATEWTSGVLVTRRTYRNGEPSELFQSGWSLQWPNRLAGLVYSRPESRLRVDGSLLASPGRVIGDVSSKFLLTQGTLGAEWFPEASGDRWRVAARASAGSIFGRVPLDQYFQLGMERDNTLWLRGHVGTRDGRKGSAPLGKEYALLQTEATTRVFSFPMLRIDAGPFYDTAWIDARFRSGGWLHDAGVQVRITSFAGISWTFVYGRNLRDGGGVFYATASRSFRSFLP